jgi:hypothetical protein
MHRRRTEIAHLAGAHDIIERIEGFLKRGVIVEAMELVEIDIIRAKALQAPIDGFHDVFARQAAIIWVAAHRIVELGGQHQLVARRIGQNPPDDFLAGAQRIHIGHVKKVDAVIEGLFNDRARCRLIQHPRRPARRPKSHAAKTKPRDFEASLAQLDIIH